MLLGYSKQGWLFLKMFKQGLPFLFHLCMRTNSFHVNSANHRIAAFWLAIYFVGQDSDSLLLSLLLTGPQSLAVTALRQQHHDFSKEALVLFRFFLFIKMNRHISLSLGLSWRLNETMRVKVLWKPFTVMKTQDHPTVPGANLVTGIGLRNVWACSLIIWKKSRQCCNSVMLSAHQGSRTHPASGTLMTGILIHWHSMSAETERNHSTLSAACFMVVFSVSKQRSGSYEPWIKSSLAICLFSRPRMFSTL